MSGLHFFASIFKKKKMKVQHIIKNVCFYRIRLLYGPNVTVNFIGKAVSRRAFCLWIGPTWKEERSSLTLESTVLAV